MNQNQQNDNQYQQNQELLESFTRFRMFYIQTDYANQLRPLYDWRGLSDAQMRTYFSENNIDVNIELSVLNFTNPMTRQDFESHMRAIFKNTHKISFDRLKYKTGTRSKTFDI